MKRVLSFSFVAIIVFTITFSCSKSNSNDPQSPVTVLSFSPAKGAAGTEVTITGTNFGVTPGENTVKFNGSIGTIISASATQLIAKVPLRAASGKISVVSPAGMGKSENDFEVLAPVNTWAQAKSFSGGDKRYAVAFVVGDRAYVTTGIGSNGSSNDVWAYDSVNDTWTQKADFAGKARRNAIAFSIMDKGYVGLGNSGALDFEKDLWQYDPATNAWTQKANFKGAAREFASAFVAGNKGYVGMGNDGSASFYKDLYEYDPVANTWTQKASLYASPRTLATGFVIGSKGYIVAGFVAGVHTDQLFEYDPALDKWTGKKTFPGAARANAVAFTIGTKAYFGTGFGKVNTSNDHLKDVWEYDPAADNWEKKADLAGVKRSGAVAFSLGNRGYIGLGGNSSFLADFWEYTK